MSRRTWFPLSRSEVPSAPPRVEPVGSRLWFGRARRSATTVFLAVRFVLACAGSLRIFLREEGSARWKGTRVLVAAPISSEAGTGRDPSSVLERKEDILDEHSRGCFWRTQAPVWFVPVCRTTVPFLGSSAGRNVSRPVWLTIVSPSRHDATILTSSTLRQVGSDLVDVSGFERYRELVLELCAS